MVGDDGIPGSGPEEHSGLEPDDSVGPAGRPRRSAANHGTNGWPESRSKPDDEGESEAEFGDDEEDAHVPEESEDDDEFDEEEAMVDDDLDQPASLVIKLSITPPKLRTVMSPIDQGPNMLPTPDAQDWKVDASIPETQFVEMQDAPVPRGHSTSAELAKKEQTPEPEINTPQTQPQTSPAHLADKIITVESHVLPATTSTSLAFRGSPEKPHAQLASPTGALNGAN